MVTTQTFEELALPNPRLELQNGVVREKPGMSIGHSFSTLQLGRQFFDQLRALVQIATLPGVTIDLDSVFP